MSLVTATSFSAMQPRIDAAVGTILAQQGQGGPLGPEFGKASPVGLLILISLLVVVIILGRSVTKRIKNLNIRRTFAEEEGIDVFDSEELNRRMADKGIHTVEAKSIFPDIRFKGRSRQVHPDNDQ